MENKPAISSIGMITKLSCSNIPAAIGFYTEKLGFTIDERYTLNNGGDWKTYSYVQLNMPVLNNNIAIGLFKDIDRPFPIVDLNNPPPGSAPTFVVADIADTISTLNAKCIAFSKINEDTSDRGFKDKYAFFTDLDNNTLVLRQNIFRIEEAVFCDASFNGGKFILWLIPFIQNYNFNPA